MHIATLDRSLRLSLLAALVLGGTAADAAVFKFDTDPFAGTTVLETPGRQFVGSELFIPVFDFANDSILVNGRVFGLPASTSFFSGLASDLPDQGADFIVLLDVDADGDLSNGVLNNAALSADLIAAQLDTPAPGFFVYFNSGLGVNRLVFSPDLSSPLSDLKIVARFTGPVGLGATDALPRFTSDNFTSAVPEAHSWAMMIAGFGLVGQAMRRRRLVSATA
jgi:hypothetical protein